MITLWYVEYCENNLGVYTREWFATKEEAVACYEELIAEHGPLGPDGATGSYGDVYEPQSTDVKPDLLGILAFANEYAVDTGAT